MLFFILKKFLEMEYYLPRPFPILSRALPLVWIHPSICDVNTALPFVPRLFAASTWALS